MPQPVDPNIPPDILEMMRRAGPIPPGASGLLVPDHLAEAAAQNQQYDGMLTGGMAAEPDAFIQPGRQKEFMERLEALMAEYKVHKLDVFWKGPFMLGTRGNGG